MDLTLHSCIYRKFRPIKVGILLIFSSLFSLIFSLCFCFLSVWKTYSKCCSFIRNAVNLYVSSMSFHYFHGNRKAQTISSCFSVFRFLHLILKIFNLIQSILGSHILQIFCTGHKQLLPFCLRQFCRHCMHNDINDNKSQKHGSHIADNRLKFKSVFKPFNPCNNNLPPIW